MKSKKPVLRVVLILISVAIFYIAFQYCLILYYKPFSNPSFEYERQKEYEELCISDSTTKIKGVFQTLSDSMCKQGFDYFKVNQTYHYSSCKDVKFKNFETFSLTYQRKKPVLFSEEKKADQFLIDITKHVFKNYVHDSIFLHYNEFSISDNFWHKSKVIKQDSLFQLIGFKVIKTGNNKFKRIKI